MFNIKMYFMEYFSYSRFKSMLKIQVIFLTFTLQVTASISALLDADNKNDLTIRGCGYPEQLYSNFTNIFYE